MNSTTTPNVSNSSHADPVTNNTEYHIVLLTIYSVVLVCGTLSIALMFRIMKCRATSTTSITVLYLIFAHLIFLLTVPFRIHYYATGGWMFGLTLCKVVSSMIHVHMYSCFFFYVTIIVMRLKLFYQNTEILTSRSKTIPLLIGAVVLVLVFVVAMVVVSFAYGTADTSNQSDCFHFGTSIQSGVKVLNYIVSMLIIAVTVVLTALQANVLRVLNGKNGERAMQQLDYGAQQKSLLFAVIMMVCFVPYLVFRLHYLENHHLENLNDVFLSLTTFNCLDLLIIIGGRSCSKCLP